MFDNLQYLKANDYIDDLIYKQILHESYEMPDKICDISNLLERIIRNGDLDIYRELEQITKEHRESENSGNENTVEKNDTVEIEDQENVRPACSHQNSDSIQQFDEEHFRKMERINKESEELARKLQAEEEELAKNLNNVDDAVCEICYVGLYEE